MCSFGLFCISLVGWIETLGELSQIVRAQILVCDIITMAIVIFESGKFGIFECGKFCFLIQMLTR